MVRARRGAAYLYLTLLSIIAMALGVLAVMALYEVRWANTRVPTELYDRMSNLTAMATVAHYCAAGVSVSDSVPTSISLTSQFNAYATSSNLSRASSIECLNINRNSDTQSKTLAGVTTTVEVNPTTITFTEYFSGKRLDVSFTTNYKVEASLRYSLGVADFNVTIYYANRLTAVDAVTGSTVLDVKIPIKFVQSQLQRGNESQVYPVDVSRLLNNATYDWVISTSLVLDPTQTTNYVIKITLLLFDGVMQEITITVTWGG